MNSSLIAEALKIYKETPFKYKAIEFFKSKGVSEEELEKQYEQLYEAYVQDRLSYYTKRNFAIWIGCIILFILTAWFFYSYVPKTFWRNSPFWTSVLGSGLLIFFLYLIVACIKNWAGEEHIRSVIEKKNDFGIKFDFFHFFLILGVIPYFIFSGRYKDEIEKQIVTNGIETEAKVINGWSEEIRARRGRIEDFYILVEFKDKKGKKQEATKEVSKSQFNKYYKGQKIQIVYDSLNPSNVEFLDNAKSIRKFTDAAERHLSANDLFEILEMNDSDLILEKLNKISPGWKKQNEYFVNERRIERLELVEGAAGYSSNSLSFNSAISPFENGEYEKAETEKSKNPFAKSNLYENEKYIIDVQQKTVTDKETYNTYLFVVISIIKK